MWTDLFWLTFGTAALTGLIVESPMGKAASSWLTGQPNEATWERWRVLAHEQVAKGLITPEEPPVAHPRLAEALSCTRCVSFWSALALAGPGSDSVSFWLLRAAVAWIGGRLLLGAARSLEAQAE